MISSLQNTDYFVYMQCTSEKQIRPIADDIPTKFEIELKAASENDAAAKAAKDDDVELPKY